MLVAAGFAAYANSLGGPFLFDDVPAIVHNPSIRHLAAAWHPPADGSGVAGRPLVNFSLALNYAAGGLDVRGYHLVNLAIHLLAGLTLFGVVRRTSTRAIGFSAALLWMVHPLATESVTCVIQRTESLSALFVLLALYGWIRDWKWAAVAACACGMLTKETAVVAPVLIVLYDYAFRESLPAAPRSRLAAMKGRAGWYAALGATWGVTLGLLQAGGAHRGAAAGFGLGVTPGTYLLTQAKAIALYLELVAWPHPLVLDYGDAVVTSVTAVLLPGLLLVTLLAVSLYALCGTTRWRAAGFLGTSFFVLLAPSSSVVPLVSQTIAEHRMYLPLAVVMAGVAAAIAAFRGARVTVGLSVACAAVLGWVTHARNAVYRSGIAIWEDTAAHAPDNPRAHNNLGLALAAVPGRAGEAILQYQAALRLRPRYPEAHNNLAILLDAAGDSGGAIAHYRAAIATRMNYPEAWQGLGIALGHASRAAEAEAAFRRALDLRPDAPEAHYNLAAQLEQMPGRAGDAAREYRRAVDLQPDYADAHYNLANVLASVPGRMPEAIVEYEAALRLNPENADAHNNLAVALASTGEVGQAIEQCRAALRLRPDFAGAQANLEKLQGHL